VTEPHEHRGTTSDRAFVLRQCECGDEVTVDYGAKAEMKEVATRLRARIADPPGLSMDRPPAVSQP
jgi:hypothetical protein